MATDCDSPSKDSASGSSVLSGSLAMQQDTSVKGTLTAHDVSMRLCVGEHIVPIVKFAADELDEPDKTFVCVGGRSALNNGWQHLSEFPTVCQRTMRFQMCARL